MSSGKYHNMFIVNDYYCWEKSYYGKTLGIDDYNIAEISILNWYETKCSPWKNEEHWLLAIKSKLQEQ